MSDKFDLNGLKEIYNESIKRQEKTLVFEVSNGKGRFLFMMFFDDADKSTKDLLYIFLKNTKKMIQLKMYGNHPKGIFNIYIDEYKRKMIIDELMIGMEFSKSTFNFNTFFANLNNCIPKTLSLQNIIDKFRESKDIIISNIPSDIIDEIHKNILIGPKGLPKYKKPQEKTLRKLYLFAEEDDSRIISQFIERLKSLNITVAWTDEKSKISANIHSLLMSLS